MSTTELVKTAPRIDRQLPLYEELDVSKAAESIGARIARLRREKGMTQVELVVSDYENDVIKLSGETIAALCQILGASADELLGLEKPTRAAGATIKNRRIYRQLQSIDRLPKRDQEALARTIDAFLAKGQ